MYEDDPAVMICLLMVCPSVDLLLIAEDSGSGRAFESNSTTVRSSVVGTKLLRVLRVQVTQPLAQ